MNKKLVLVVALAALLLIPAPAFAKSNSSLTHEQKVEQIKVKLAAKIARITQKQVKSWQKQAGKKIRKDINRLNRLIAITNKKTTLTAEQKSAIVNDINTDITSLNDLKAKINADTDVATVKTDVKSIMTLGSINAKYLPRINAVTITP